MEIVYPRSCGVDVHKSFIVSLLSASLNPSNPSTLKKDSQPSITSSFNSGIGLLKTTVKMYAWNQPASTISLYTMH